MRGRFCALRVAQANPAPTKATSMHFDIMVPPKANLSRENTSVARKYSWFHFVGFLGLVCSIPLTTRALNFSV